MIRCLRTTPLARSVPLGGEDGLLLVAALDEPVRLEALQHLPGRGARDAEHLGDAGRDRGRPGRGPVLPDREREEVDGLQVLVDRVAVRLCHGDILEVGGVASAKRTLRSPQREASGSTLYLGAVPLAEIYPLVTARTLARLFTYEVGEDVERGTVVSVNLGRRRVRGVVVDVGVEAPTGVEIATAGAVVDRIPAPLVELALWVADYYGSTPARALALVAPHARARRGERRPPALGNVLEGEPEPATLTDAQRDAVDRIVAALDGGSDHVLLHGPTGSGKTEVYLQACAVALARDRSAIVLVPEIALTPQTVGRFAARFGDQVAVVHSALTEAERRDERERIASGEARVVVGARSAIFAPVRNLGLIVVDEEHDASFKQESDPRYDARTVAAKRAALEGAVAVYGSATPRAESWARLERLALPSRIGAPMPSVRVVDLRREAGYPLSAPLLAELAAVEEKRWAGSAAPQSARRLGRDPLSRLRRLAPLPKLRRHADAAPRRTTPLPPLRILGGASGALPGVRIRRARPHRRGNAAARSRARAPCAGARADSARRGHRDEAGLVARRASERFGDADRVVLIGTQMVAKGHHFPGVSVAAVVDADTGLAFPDFRAEERTFQLVTQLAGAAAGTRRGGCSSRPSSRMRPRLRSRLRHDVAGFLAQELERREQLAYPPFSHLVSIVVSGAASAAPLRVLRELQGGAPGPDVRLIGPAPLLRLRGRHRAQLVAKTTRPRAFASRAAALLAAAAPAMRRDGLSVVVDVDPQSL